MWACANEEGFERLNFGCEVIVSDQSELLGALKKWDSRGDSEPLCEQGFSNFLVKSEEDWC